MPKGNALANCHEKAAPLGAFMPPNCSSSVERAYMVPARWPLDAWHLIMETQPSTCDLYRVSSFCCQFGSETFREPERHVWDAISSFLAHCPRRNERERCTAVDLGANNGWFTAIMLQHGSRVTAVEPSPNFANAVRETGEVNCWADRLTVHNARACIAEDTKCFAPVPSSCDGPGWRWGSGPSRMQTTLASCSATHAEATKVGGVDLRETLLRASREPRIPGGPRELDLLKLDADGPEGAWLAALEPMMRNGLLTVGSMIVEGSNLSPALMHALDTKHNFTFYRLDEHDGRRWIGRDGWDKYSPHGTIAPLGRLGAVRNAVDRQRTKYSPRFGGMTPMGDNVSRMALEDELFGVRAMKHVFRVKRNIGLQGWVTVLNPVMPHGYPPQWAMTRLPDLTEPVFSTSFAHTSPEQRAWLASKAAGSNGGSVEEQSSTPTALPATEHEDGTARRLR